MCGRVIVDYDEMIPVASGSELAQWITGAPEGALSEKRTFAPALKHQRCAVVVSGFYEWTGPRKARVPHAVFGPNPMLVMAGLYSWWRDPNVAEHVGWNLTATILTRDSAGVMEPLHDRMPVLLSEELLCDWLDPVTVGNQLLVDAVSEASAPLASDLREWAVRPLRGDGPELILPV